MLDIFPHQFLDLVGYILPLGLLKGQDADTRVGLIAQIRMFEDELPAFALRLQRDEVLHEIDGRWAQFGVVRLPFDLFDRRLFYVLRVVDSADVRQDFFG